VPHSDLGTGGIGKDREQPQNTTTGDKKEIRDDCFGKV
jgi:hypothetical protein